MPKDPKGSNSFLLLQVDQRHGTGQDRAGDGMRQVVGWDEMEQDRRWDGTVGRIAVHRPASSRCALCLPGPRASSLQPSPKDGARKQPEILKIISAYFLCTRISLCF